ncbi:2-oxoglutarate dehydrogenase, E2 component, dihydrolipoamide succinyltransferase [Geodermatophilus obscurus]|uniref:Dihydrolipoamide acetyltransferase component of pyruvate dehydrogenase complex n=1 Tax=Geodermatophilus obscurus (strain ATCC 25078 / DSM 43160 / JCM 3152 / CCUG 61914 / KCC A-0152 / KCTC 9177 / NBRC 13315 / NRRL B-3577 / G-20) TaxID=526225 RepID=D2SAS8_GEOOG|nr:2-oxoglutarate dehydrogenase, E2 component, dihydrolipoamide succinyltransferase [Geodermatophilus obscurus]ADB75963.1 2-oxoglutarate dehydrogenase, E2 component, dihydrolipoamide succinyltransferase [Geodermatophilus obscurus DSM 43160]
MPTSVTMPALGESVTEGTVTRWLKQEGEQVEVDEPLLEVSTDKVDTEIPSPAAGVLSRILVSEDETVEVGAELAVIGGDGDGGGAGGPESAEDTDTTPQTPVDQVEDAGPGPSDEQQPAAAAPASDGGSGGGGGGEGTPVTMPALGESVTEGTVTRWLKSVGDEVTADEPLLEVSTDKVDTEIPAPVSGTLLSISVDEDETVEVGAELAVIGSGSAGGGAPAQAPAPSAPAQQEPQSQQEPREPAPPAQATQPTPQADPTPQRAQPSSEQPGADYGSGGVLPSTSPTDAPSPAQAVAPQAPAAPKTPAPAPAGDGGGQYVTPLVRRLAADRGVDLSSVTGTGVGGRIRKQDVIAAAEKAAAPAEAPAPAAAASGRPTPSPSPAAQPDTSLRGRTEKLSRLRTVIARRMVESLQVSAQLTTVVEADVTTIARLRDRAKRDFEAREGVKLSFLPFFAKAAVEALKAHPAVNSSIDLEAGTVTYHDAENLGVAVDTERGLLVPVIRDAGDLSIGGLARKIADLAERTRTNKVTPDELGGGTFTLTNTGSRGALFDTPIINQPQVAILGLGSVVKRPVVVQDPGLGEVIAVRSMVYLALTYDHRIVDGADAARFLVTVKERLEAGQFQGELGLS